MGAYDIGLQDKMNQSAESFSKSLMELGGILQNQFEKVVRKTVLDLFSNIVRRSPIDTGSYRASHGIANHEPAGDEGIIKIPKGGNPGSAQALALAKAQGWIWSVGSGTIFIFNNLPYAEPLENGHSGQAPQGIYRQAMTEVEAIMQKQITQLKVTGFFK